LARHGKTNENVEKFLSGNSNNAYLIKEGKTHAQNLVRIFSRYKIDKVFSSPLIRAIETARPLSEALKIKIKKDDRLREFDFGIFDNKKEVGEAKKAIIKRRRNINFRFPKGESYADVLKRTSAFLDGLLKKDYKTVFIQAHGGVNRTIMSILLDRDSKNLDQISIPNTVVYEIDTKKKTCYWKNTLTKKSEKGLLFRKKV